MADGPTKSKISLPKHLPFRFSKQEKRLFLSAVLLFILSFGVLTGLRLIQKSQEQRAKAIVDGVQLILNPSSTELQPGQTANFDLIINTANGPNHFCVGALVIELTYDPQVVQLDSFTLNPNSPFNSLIAPSINPSTSDPPSPMKNRAGGKL